MSDSASRTGARLATDVSHLARGDDLTARLDDGRRVTGVVVHVSADQCGRAVTVVPDHSDDCWRFLAARAPTGWYAVHASRMTRRRFQWERYGRVVAVE